MTSTYEHPYKVECEEAKTYPTIKSKRFASYDDARHWMIAHCDLSLNPKIVPA